MKINELRLRNFMGLDADIPLEQPVNIFFGANGAGKTAILDALYWLFLGKVPHRGLRNKNQSQMLATNGAGEMCVEADTTNGEARRSVKSSTALIPPMRVKDELSLSILLNPAGVLAMEPKERQKVFSALFQSADTKTEARTFLNLMVDEKVIDRILEDPDAAQKWAIEQRREAGRKQKELTLEQPVKDRDVSGKVFDLATVNAGTLGGEIATLEQELRTIPHATPKMGLPESELRKMEAEIVGILKALDCTELQAAMETARQAVQEQENLLRAKTQKREEHKKELDRLHKQLKDVQGLKGTCPCCQRAITAASMGKVIAELDSQIKMETGIVYKLDTEANDINNLAIAKNTQFDEKEKAVYLLNATKKRKEAELAEIRADLEALEGQKTNAEKVQAITRKIENRKALREAALSYRADVEAYTKQQQQLQKITGELKMYDEIDHVLKPDGELRKILTKDVKAVQWDTLAQQWGMESLSLNEDGTVSLYGRPIEMASKSEQWRASVLLAELLSRTIGEGILILDGADILGDTNKRAMKEALARWKENYETILVNNTAETMTKRPAPDWMQYFLVAHGAVIALEQNAEAAA